MQTVCPMGLKRRNPSGSVQAHILRIIKQVARDDYFECCMYLFTELSDD